MKAKYFSIAVLLLCLLLIIPAGIAGDAETEQPTTKPTEKPTITPTVDPTDAYEREEVITTVYDGATPITDLLNAKGDTETRMVALKDETKKILKATKFPYSVSLDTTVVTIDAYFCDSMMCGYWISATRGGQEVATNSPIWIYDPGTSATLYTVVSEVTDSKVTDDTAKKITEYKTITLKEDPKGAVETILLRHAGDTGIGKAVRAREPPK